LIDLPNLETAGDLGLSLNRSKICPNCLKVIKNANWYAHMEGHRVFHLRRRGEIEW
jgi:hypothetical protein